MKADNNNKGTHSPERLTLKENQNTPKAKKKKSNPIESQLNLKYYISSFENPKESNTNNSFYENFLNHIQEDKKMISSCQFNNDIGEVKAIQIKNVKSNFLSVQKISFHKSTNNKTRKISSNAIEGQNDLNKEEENQFEDNNDRKCLTKDIKNKQPKIGSNTGVDKNNNDHNDNQQVNEVKEEAQKKKKKILKVQRTKAPPALIKKKNYIFCCIPISKIKK